MRRFRTMVLFALTIAPALASAACSEPVAVRESRAAVRYDAGGQVTGDTTCRTGTIGPGGRTC